MVKCPEKLLEMIWKCRLYAKADLNCINEDIVQVIAPGVQNQDAGPDFLQAKLRINKILWVGHVELHWYAKDWYTHQHHKDERYDNVILHVVWEGSHEIARKDGSIIPTLQLKKYVGVGILPLYNAMIRSKTWIPCANQLHVIPTYMKAQVLDRMITSRLEDKAAHICSLLSRCANDWEKVARHLFAESFGMRVNKNAFARLIDSLPDHIVDRYQGNTEKMEALLFGQAGLLQEYQPEIYYNKLREEYNYLQKLHRLQPMESHEWRFLRMRPANFPTVRIAQLAAVFTQVSRLCHLIITAQNLPALQRYFSELRPSDYWSTHYRFGKHSKPRKVVLTTAFLDHLAINCFILLIYTYGRCHGMEYLQKRAADWLNQLTAERNNITANFAKYGLLAQHAADSQAMLQLHRTYCEHKQCLSCTIGVHLLGRS